MSHSIGHPSRLRVRLPFGMQTKPSLYLMQDLIHEVMELVLLLKILLNEILKSITILPESRGLGRCRVLPRILQVHPGNHEQGQRCLRGTPQSVLQIPPSAP